MLTWAAAWRWPATAKIPLISGFPSRTVAVQLGHM